MSEAAREPRLFAVITWGAAGSMWLTKLLNAHPEVFCLHSLQRQLNRRFGQSLDDEAYLQAIARQARSYRLAGDVHGIDLHGLDDLRRTFGEQLGVATLVRHPVPRVVSQWAVMQNLGLDFYRLPFRRLRWSLPRPLRARFDDREKLFFVHVMGLVNRIVLESRLTPVHTLERLSTEVAAADALLAELSHGELSFPASVLESVWAEPLNAHASPRRAPRDPKEAFASLAGWQQDAFGALLSPEARERYEALGYDLSFV